MHARPMLGCVAWIGLTAGCALASPRDTGIYVSAEYAPPTIDLLHAVKPGIAHTRWRVNEGRNTTTFPPTIAVQCTGPTSCRHAAVKAELTVAAKQTRAGVLLVGEFVSTVGRNVVVEHTAVSTQYLKLSIGEGVEVITEGQFTTPINHTLIRGETFELPGYGGAKLSLQLQPIP